MNSNVAHGMLKSNWDMTFCYISGEEIDSLESSKSMWARVKWKTEYDLPVMPFRSVYIFCLAFIRPMCGVQSCAPVYNIVYAVFIPFNGIL